MVKEAVPDLLCMWAGVASVQFTLTVDINLRPEFDENDKDSPYYLLLLEEAEKVVSA